MQVITNVAYRQRLVRMSRERVDAAAAAFLADDLDARGRDGGSWGPL